MKKSIAGCLTAALATLAFSSLAMAAPHHPKGEFAPFADCPLNRASLSDCVYQTVTAGSFTIGKKTVPLKNPITLQGGFEGGGTEISFFGAEDGNTLSKTPQPVPGGLLGINPPASWPKSAKEKFNDFIDNGFTGVTATVELAAPATSIRLNVENLIDEQGVAVQMPVKVKLDNRLLGNNCYIGSNSSPMVLSMTTGTTAPPAPNLPISGSFGPVSFNPAFTFITLGARLVDNAFSVPKASGCGGLLSPFIDPLVNSLVGSPSPAGRNTAILEGTMLDASASAVRESEK